jgi:hypothetical protein
MVLNHLVRVVSITNPSRPSDIHRERKKEGRRREGLLHVGRVSCRVAYVVGGTRMLDINKTTEKGRMTDTHTARSILCHACTFLLARSIYRGLSHTRLNPRQDPMAATHRVVLS